jgi:hypothetical protein
MDSKCLWSRFFFAVLPILLILSSATSINAQGLFGMRFPGLSSFGGYRGDAPPRQFTFYGGYVADPSDGLAITATIHGFWVGEYETTFNSPFRGAWLGLSTDLLLTNSMGVTASAGLLIPSGTRGSATSDSSDQPHTIPDNRFLNQFSIIDGALYLNTSASIKLLGGFRWDRLDTTPKMSRGGFAERNDFTINAYLPYIGAQVDQGGATVRMIGFPAVLGDFRTAERIFFPPEFGFPGAIAASESRTYRFRSGQFIEVFASYTSSLSDSMELGGFLTYNYLHGQTVYVTPTVFHFFPGEAASFTLNRRFWTLGGSFSWNFSLL